jgi:glycine/D-amino acid oxidase-like deaminating enzyme
VYSKVMLALPDTEHSYWRESYTPSLYPALSQNITVDVAIVGAGITGLTAAYLLKRAGLTVAVLDKDTVGGGTSGRTTGKVTSQHNLIYNDLQKRLGVETARLYGEANQTAVEQVAAIVRSEKLDCEWQRRDNYTFTDSPTQLASLRQEARVAAELGLPASFETSAPLPFPILGAVKFSGQAKINSQKYLLGLARAVHGGGSVVHEHSHVIGIRDGNPGRIRTTAAIVTARHIIVATNAPTLPLMARGGYCALQYPRESYIVAGRLERPLTGMYISPDKHNYSILPVTINDEPSVLVGGAGHISGVRMSRKAHYRQLATYAEQKLGVTAITHRWSDRDYLAYDSLPLVGKLYPWSRNLYVATAYRKWGLSNGTASAIILRDLITGKENPWAAAFHATRLRPVASIPRVAFKTVLSALK